MELDSGLYKLVQEYYETRILYGCYAYGDRLPSIPAIASMFHLAPATVRSALSLLEQQGYVSLEPRRTAKVVYQAQPAKRQEDAARYFSPRMEGIMDMVKSSRLLLAPLLEKGLAQWGEADWEQLRQNLAHSLPGEAPFAVAYYLRVFRPLHNRLLFNLFWEMIRYIRLPYLSDETGGELEGLDDQNLTEAALADLLNQRFLCSYERAMERVGDFTRWAAREYSLEEVRPIPFQWNIYRQRPQLRYTLVCWILREVIHGTYPPGSYLPSLPKLAKHYEVSLNTVRRTLDILEGLGMVKAQQGKGVLVCEEPQPVDFTRPEIQEGMRLCQESLQLLSLTIQPVMRHTMESAPAERWKALASRFAGLRQEGKSYLCFDSCLDLVEEECPMAFIREVYSKARELLIWGYPFKVQRLKHSGLNREYEAILATAEAHLQQGDLEGFAGDWGDLFAREEQLFQEYMNQKIR